MFNLIKFIFILSLLHFCNWSWARVEDGIPLKLIATQLFNFSIFAGILIYIIKTKLPQKLKQTYDDFISMNQRAETLYKQATQEQKEIHIKTKTLQKRKDKSEEELDEEISRLEKSLDAQMKAECSSILRVAQNFVDQEWMRQKRLLQKEFLEKVSDLSTEICKNSDPQMLLNLKSKEEVQ